MLECTYRTLELPYASSVSDETQKAIIERMWRSNRILACLGELANIFRPSSKKKNGEDTYKIWDVDEDYIQHSIRNHWKIRQRLLSTPQEYALDGKMLWVPRIPQVDGSDTLLTFRSLEIPKVIEDVPEYVLGTGEILIRNRQESVTKIMAPVGSIVGEYAVLSIPDKMKMPWFKVTTIPRNGGYPNIVNTPLQNIMQLYLSESEIMQAYIAEGLIKTLDVAEKEGILPKDKLDYIHRIKLPNRDTMKTSMQHPEKTKRQPRSTHNMPQTEEAIYTLFDMHSGGLPRDEYLAHRIYALLSEPGNLEEVQQLFYDKMKETISIVKGVSAHEIWTKITDEERMKVRSNNSIIEFLRSTSNSNYLPKYMDLTLGEKKTMEILNCMGYSTGGTLEKTLKRYVSDDTIPVSFLKKPIDNGKANLFYLNNYRPFYRVISEIA